MQDFGLPEHVARTPNRQNHTLVSTSCTKWVAIRPKAPDANSQSPHARPPYRGDASSRTRTGAPSRSFEYSVQYCQAWLAMPFPTGKREVLIEVNLST